MTTRVTDKMVYSQAGNAINRTRGNLVKNQEQGTSGKRISRPSDDPAGLVRSLDLKQQLAQNKQLQTNVVSTNAIMKISENALGDLSDVLARAKELAVSMSNSTNQEKSVLQSASAEVEQLFSRALQIGNTRVGDRYIFGGYQTLNAPFDHDGNYFGDDGIIQVEVDSGHKVSMNIPGSFVFYGVDKIAPEASKIRENGSKGIPTLGLPLESELRGPASAIAKSATSGVEAQATKEALKAAEKGGEKLAEKVGVGQAGGGVNVLKSLKDFNDSLKGGNIKGINSALDTLEEAFQQVVTSRSMIGSQQKTLEMVQSSLEHDEVTKIDLNSRVEDADALKVFSDLAKDEHALNASLETSKRLITPSLLDFLK